MCQSHTPPSVLSSIDHDPLFVHRWQSQPTVLHHRQPHPQPFSNPWSTLDTDERNKMGFTGWRRRLSSSETVWWSSRHPTAIPDRDSRTGLVVFLWQPTKTLQSSLLLSR